MRLYTVAAALLLLTATPAMAQVGSPAGPVPPQMLAKRRELLLDRIGDGLVVLRSARIEDAEGEDYPQASDFRQDNDFFYLTGLEAADAWLVLIARSNAADDVVLYIPPRNPEQEQWTGPGMDTAAAALLSGIKQVRRSARLAQDLSSSLKPGTSLYVKLPAAAGEVCGDLQGSHATDCAWQFLKPISPASAELRDVREQIAALRLIKDTDEIGRLRRAIDITGDALTNAMRKAKAGAWEYQIEADIEHDFHAAGAERVGFPTIVGSGPNSTVLHYDKSRRQTTAGDLVVMDVGAEFGYYTADVTRTMPISGTFTPRQRALYQLVLGAQQAVIDSVHPGMTLPRMDEIARQYMQRNSGTLCGARSCDQYFIHAIGHWLGMDVHDPGSMMAAFTPGMVVTVEPGVYLSTEGLGIRIEDDVLVTGAGHELLSGKAPRRAEDIEKLMHGEKVQ